jgi:uncharacterized membrane protein
MQRELALDMPSHDAAEPVARNIRAIADLERRAVHDRTPVERATDAITRGTGSPGFIVVQVVFFTSWIWWNTHHGGPDPYPFTLLNLLVSLEAIFLASFVLMTQERMTRQADKRANLDLQVNLLAEQELTAILRIVSALSQKAGVSVRLEDDRIAALIKETDVETLASALDTALAEPEPPPE